MPYMSAAEETLTLSHEEDIVASQLRTIPASAEGEDEECMWRDDSKTTQPQPRVRYSAVDAEYPEDLEEEEKRQDDVPLTALLASDASLEEDQGGKTFQNWRMTPELRPRNA